VALTLFIINFLKTIFHELVFLPDGGGLLPPKLEPEVLVVVTQLSGWWHGTTI
jgi:hypothetical protein